MTANFLVFVKHRAPEAATKRLNPISSADLRINNSNFCRPYSNVFLLEKIMYAGQFVSSLKLAWTSDSTQKEKFSDITSGDF